MEMMHVWEVHTECAWSGTKVVRSFSLSLPLISSYFGFRGGDRRMTVLTSCMILTVSHAIWLIICVMILMCVRVVCEVQIHFHTFPYISRYHSCTWVVCESEIHSFLHTLLTSRLFTVIFYLNPHKSSLSHLLLHFSLHLCWTIRYLSWTYVVCNPVRLVRCVRNSS